MGWNEKAVRLVKESEGCSLVAYQDQKGIWTIGYGHTKGVKPGDTCTGDQALIWLGEDLEEAAEGVKNLVGSVELNENQFAALVDFAYNEGLGRLAGSTLLQRVRAGQFTFASEEFEKWDKITINGVKRESSGLLARRQKEKELFLTPA